MWETAELQPAQIELTLPEHAQGQFEELRRRVTHKSSVVWGEHCTECAFPSCYSNCSFYTPREDMHCRRFVNGIERGKGPLASRLGLVQIAFRRWGKLEGRGPLRMKTVGSARVYEKLDAGLMPLLRLAPRNLATNSFWRVNNLKHDLAARGEPIHTNDQFLVEAWHDGSIAIPFTLTFLPTGSKSDRLFQVPISLSPGYNRLFVPAAQIAARLDLAQPYLVQLEPVIENPPPIVFGLVDSVRLHPAAASETPLPASVPKADPTRTKVKCVVWDLDNTVWQGTLAEDGIEGL